MSFIKQTIKNPNLKPQLPVPKRLPSRTCFEAPYFEIFWDRKIATHVGMMIFFIAGLQHIFSWEGGLPLMAAEEPSRERHAEFNRHET